MSATIVGLPPQTSPALTGVAPLTPDGKGVDLNKGLMYLPLWLFLRRLETLANSGGGTAGGDLSGTLADATVIALQGKPIDPGAPSTGNVLAWNGSEWIGTAPSVTPGAATIDYHTITIATTIHASVMPAPANGLLRVFLTMGAAAVQPAWAGSDFSIAPGALALAVGTRSIICFCADGSGKWAMEAPPVTNR